MPYSDEPILIRQRKLSAKQWAAVSLGIFVCLVFASALLVPIWQSHRRDHHPRGHHGGWEYTIKEADVIAEVIRAPSPTSYQEDQLYVCLIRPEDHDEKHEEGHTQHLKDYEVAVWQNGQWMSLPWNENFNLYGPGDFTLITRQDQKIRLRISREGRMLWEGKVWAFSPDLAKSSGHHH